MCIRDRVGNHQKGTLEVNETLCGMEGILSSQADAACNGSVSYTHLKEEILKTMAAYKDVSRFQEIIPVSAMKKTNTDTCLLYTSGMRWSAGNGPSMNGCGKIFMP